MSHRRNRDGNGWRAFGTRSKENSSAAVFTSCAEAAAAIFDYIEGFYNRKRLCRTLSFMSAVELKKQSNLT